jgi:protein TonB
MTNNEILQSNLPDIIFENRNKDYGAYALRRTYNNRLLIALGLAMSTILLFILINALDKKSEPVINAGNDNDGIVLKEYTLPKEPEKPKEVIKEAAKPVQKVAAAEYLSKIEIKPDLDVTKTMTAIKDLDGKVISDKTTEGVPYTGIVTNNDQPAGITGDGVAKAPEVKTNDFVIDEREPEFPGGPEALRRFLGSYLSTPDELENGEKKTVKIRFKVDQDGSVSGLEIAESGGAAFDKEVMRVCKKMPRWKPAIQNGIHVPVSYVLPVTFIGAEQ